MSGEPDEQTTDEIEYELKYDEEHGWMLIVESGCPKCGNDGLFNAELVLTSQYHAIERDQYENRVLTTHDTYQVEVVFLKWALSS
jgi:hypothetical protein